MKSARGWIIAGLISIAIAAAAYFVQPHQDSPEHNSNSDAANDTSAARLFAESMGHPTDQISGPFIVKAITGEHRKGDTKEELCYVRKYGDNYEYSPMVICDGDAIVGYVTLVCDPASFDDYWIDDIIIDAIYQGRGYGRAAMKVVLALIQKRYLKCRIVKLTCFRGNDNAAALYKSLGFEMTGEVDPMFHEPTWALTVKPPRV